MLYSTMQDVPLTLTSILRYGTEIHGDRVVITATDDGFRQIDYREFGTRVAQLAHGLHRLGVRAGDRVGTFMWNTQEHLEAYFAIPCMGAVLHPLNIRLSDEQIEFIVYDAEDCVVIVDMSLAEQLAAVLPRMETVRTVVAVGEGDIGVLESAGKDVLRYERCWPTGQGRTSGPISMKGRQPLCVTPAARRVIRRVWSTDTGPPTCTAWPFAARTE